MTHVITKYWESGMTDTLVVGHGSELEEARRSAVSWPAIVAGGTATAALPLLLLAFGTGTGFSVVSPWSGSGIAATTFSIWTGLYLAVIAMLSSSIGGYLAGRLRTKWAGAHTHEVHFRDTAHGFLAWAFATVLGAAVLGAAATSIISGASSGLSQAAGAGAAQGGGPTASYIDSLLRADPATAKDRGEVSPASRGELARLSEADSRRHRVVWISRNGASNLT